MAEESGVGFEEKQVRDSSLTLRMTGNQVLRWRSGRQRGCYSEAGILGRKIWPRCTVATREMAVIAVNVGYSSKVYSRRKQILPARKVFHFADHMAAYFFEYTSLRFATLMIHTTN